MNAALATGLFVTAVACSAVGVQQAVRGRPLLRLGWRPSTDVLESAPTRRRRGWFFGSRAGPLEVKLQAIREAGFSQVMLSAGDLAGHAQPAAPREQLRPCERLLLGTVDHPVASRCDHVGPEGRERVHEMRRDARRVVPAAVDGEKRLPFDDAAGEGPGGRPGDRRERATLEDGSVRGRSDR